MRVRNAALRRRSDSANASGPRGSSSATSTATPVIDSTSALSTPRCTVVRPLGGADAVANARAIVCTSSGVGRSRSVSASVGNGTVSSSGCMAARMVVEDQSERVRRIELPSSDWKSEALPLSYTRVCPPALTRPASGRGDLNPRPPAPKAGALPLRYSPDIKSLRAYLRHFDGCVCGTLASTAAGRDRSGWSTRFDGRRSVVRLFQDRRDAGRQLASRLNELRSEHPIVVGLPARRCAGRVRGRPSARRPARRDRRAEAGSPLTAGARYGRDRRRRCAGAQRGRGAPGGRHRSRPRGGGGPRTIRGRATRGPVPRRPADDPARGQDGDPGRRRRRDGRYRAGRDRSGAGARCSARRARGPGRGAGERRRAGGRRRRGDRAQDAGAVPRGG